METAELAEFGNMKKPATLAECDRLTWFLLRLVFKLRYKAFARINIIAQAEIHRLIQAKAVPVSVEVTNLYDGSDRWNLMVGWDGDIPAGNQAPALKQAD